MPKPYRRLLRAALPRLDERAAELLEFVLLRDGDVGTAAAAARALRLADAPAVNDLLRRAGLPAFHRLAAWVRVIEWVVTWEQDGTSLCRQALDAGRDPAACYRTVQAVTGVPWRTLQRRGSAWALMELLARCGSSQRGARRAAAGAS